MTGNNVLIGIYCIVELQLTAAHLVEKGDFESLGLICRLSIGQALDLLSAVEDAVASVFEESYAVSVLVSNAYGIGAVVSASKLRKLCHRIVDVVSLITLGKIR